MSEFAWEKKPLSKLPVMGFREIDLYQLFMEVNRIGGYHQAVTQVGSWSKIWKRLSNYDPSITDSSFRLKRNYERFLLEYEFFTYPEHKIRSQELGLPTEAALAAANKTRKRAGEIVLNVPSLRLTSSRKRTASQLFTAAAADENTDYYSSESPSKRRSLNNNMMEFDEDVDGTELAISTLMSFRAIN